MTIIVTAETACAFILGAVTLTWGWALIRTTVANVKEKTHVYLLPFAICTVVAGMAWAGLGSVAFL